MLLAIEVADAGLIALPEEGEASAPSPGIAIIDGRSIVTGRAAEARARRTPRRVHNSFWSEISTEVIGGSFGTNLRTADLAWTHLSQFWQEAGHGVTGVILALPGGCDANRTSVILGVARAAGLPVDGLVDAPVAASVGRVNDGTAIHLDLELHRAVMTVIASGPRRKRVHISEDIGLLRLNDLWLRWVAGVFLKTTRYDPFHSAGGEQDLYDQLPSILDRLARSESTSVSLTADDKVFTVDLTRQAAITAVSRFYSELDALVDIAGAEHPKTLLLSSRAAAAPGLSNRLADRTELEAITLPLAAAAAGALEFATRIRAPGTALPLVTDLGGASTAPTRLPQATTAETAPRCPTHLVVGGVAHKLNTDPMWLGSRPEAGARGVSIGAGAQGIRDRHCSIRLVDGRVVVDDLGGGGCAVNGQPMVGETTLSAGDRLHLGSTQPGDGGIEVDLISVES